MQSADVLHEGLTVSDDEQDMTRRPKKGAFFPSENAALKALGVINAELIRRAVCGSRPPLATLDLDATLIESHKRGTLLHHTGGRAECLCGTPNLCAAASVSPVHRSW